MDRDKINKRISKGMKGKQNALKGDKPRNTNCIFRCNDEDKAQWEQDAIDNGYKSATDYYIDLLNGVIK